LGDFLIIAAVEKPVGGASDGSEPLNRPEGRDRTPLIRAPSQMLPSLVRASRVKRLESRAFVAAGECLAGDCGPPRSAPILNQIFITIMIGS